MNVKPVLRALSVGLLSLGLSGCTINATVDINQDLLINGQIEASVPISQLKETVTDSPSCTSFADNFNKVQKVNQMQPTGRIVLEVEQDRSTDTDVDCTFRFRRWDPNVNRRVLWAAGEGYIFNTTEPASVLLNSLGPNTDFSVALTFPDVVTRAEGGTISGNTVTYTSADAFRHTGTITAGDPDKQSIWQRYSLGLILLAAIPAAAIIVVALRKGTTSDDKDEE